MTSVEYNFLVVVHMALIPHPLGPDPLRVDVINGWPFILAHGFPHCYSNRTVPPPLTSNDVDRPFPIIDRDLRVVVEEHARKVQKEMRF